MTIGELKKLIKKYKIPDKAVMLSDSGWECSETDMDGVYYNKEKAILIFTQNCSPYHNWDKRYIEWRRAIDSPVSEKFLGYEAIGKEEER